MIENQYSETNPNLERTSDTVDTSIKLAKNLKRNLEKYFTLKTKATLFAIAIGVIPIAIVGYLAHNVTNRSLSEQINQEQLEKTELAADSVTRFLEDRIREVDSLTKNPLFIDSKLRQAATLEEKTAVLDSFANELKYYNSILFFDLKGDLLFQASIEEPYTGNYGGNAYFQEAIATKSITINGPGISSSSGQLRVEFAAPVQDRETGELVGVIRAKVPGNYINSLFEVYEKKNEHWSLINAEGTIFAGDREELLNQEIATRFPEIQKFHEEREVGTTTTVYQAITESEPISETDIHEHDNDIGKKQLVSYVPAESPERFPNLHIGTIIAKHEDIALASIKQLDRTLFLGSAIAAILVAAIAAYIANRATVPIVNAVTAVKKIGSGELDTRLAVTTQDELGELNANINLMTEQIQNSLKQQQALTDEQRQERERLEREIFVMLDEVSGAMEGDLTVRASLTSMEMSTVADLFNAIIDSLQEIAIAAKQSTGQVGSALKENEESIRRLAEQAIAEAEETRDTLKSVAAMSQSIQAVAENANQAESIVNDTYNTVVNSTSSMDSTVDSILALRTIVAETAKKMKRLGESSQKISQAVSFIEEIALRTNVLSINATVEAGRAGEYGEGFTIVAEQVGALSEQCAAATKEIASIVATIQAETQDVNQAMESGTAQVVETTRLVESTKQSLNLVLEKSQAINQLMGSISQTTVSQADTSQSITSLMQKIARLSSTTSKSSQEVAESIAATALVAQKLESTVAQFKVAEFTQAIDRSSQSISG
ncbi:methyl-accepting chemotaxis protein [Myxosarcina sp. GI1]|uniref:methyl-accepting chemotaxis protein n=1 Tax=Myxosarcina sp. GI1 TaxID=1541065 RepID=UPI00068C551C|nr:methyl-accepting chemotaxis protein [Myxosarcina sp. GI1]